MAIADLAVGLILGSLLREPRWRWRSAGGSGWGRGHGIIDPQDFYVVDAAQSP